MKKFSLFLILLVAAQSKALVKPNMACIVEINQSLRGLSFGYSPLFMGSDGKIHVEKYSQVKPIIDAGKEIYSFTNPYGAEVKIVVTKNSEGDVVSISSPTNSDLIKGAQKYNESQKANLPVIKDVQSDIVYSGQSCSLNQTFMVVSQNDKDAKKVVYDKKFCDQLEPLMKQMGTENAAKCTNLISAAQLAFEARQKELRTEDKTKSFDEGWVTSSKSGSTEYLRYSTAIAACALHGASGGLGEAPFGYNTPGALSAYGMGGPWGLGSIPKSAPSTPTNTPSVDPGIR